MNPNYKKKVVENTPNPIFSNTKANEEHNKKYNFIQSDFDAEQNIKNGGLAYWHNNKHKLNIFDPQKEEKTRLANTILTGLNQPLTNNTIEQTIKILEEGNSKNPIVELGRTIKESDLVYVEAGMSAEKLAAILPVSPKIKQLLSANASFIYSKSLDDCYIVGSVGGNVGITPIITGSISFIHATDEIKQLQQQLKQELDEKRKNDLKRVIDDKTREVIKDVGLELNAILGVGAKSMFLKDGRKISGFGIGLNAGVGNSFSNTNHIRSMRESAKDQYDAHKKGDGGIDW